LRRGGETGEHGVDYSRLTGGVAAPGGGAIRTPLFAGGLGGAPTQCGYGSTRSRNYEVYRRASGGVWQCDAIFNIAPLRPGGHVVTGPGAVSSSLEVGGYQLIPALFSSGVASGIRVLDDDGGP